MREPVCPVPLGLRASCIALALWCAALSGCGPGALEAFDVAIVPALQCTRNASSQQCDDPERLAEQRVLGRWTFEHGVNGTFSMVNHEGEAVTGITLGGSLDTLDAVLEGQPCLFDRGLCYFGRRRYESTDFDNNGCTRFGQFVVVLRREDDGTFVGRTSDIAGTDDQCGTASITERIEDVTGVLSSTAALAREEAL